MSPAYDDRGLLAIFLDEAAALLDRVLRDRDRALAGELLELSGVIGDPELGELIGGLVAALDRGHDPAAVGQLVSRKLVALAAPPPPPSSWDPAELAEMRALFLTEARAHLSAIESAFAELTADPTAKAPYDALYRKVHTLKGSAGSIDLHALSEAAHRLEDLLAAARGRGNAALVEAVGAGLPELRRLIADDAQGGVPVAPMTSPLRSGPIKLPSLDALRMDELLDAASELVLDRTRIERRLRTVEELAGEAGPGLRAQLAELGADVATLARTTRRLGERLRRLRAIELSALASRLEPVVVSAARRERKQVQLVTRGGGEEIDQRLADALSEPLLHLLRNAVAHGVEAPEVRAAAGKPATATITLGLRQTGDGLELEVADDGAGVDLDAVRRALVTAERLTADEAARLPDDAVLATLFQPGISTRALADDLAGRGVGLDAVADAIARLGGDVAVESTAGRGCRFSIRVPVESRVLEALLFKVGDQLFAVPSARVEEVAEVDREQVSAGADRLRVGDEDLPLVRLGALLRIPPPPGLGGRRVALVLHARGALIAATCDRVIGPREIVVRRLPPSLTGLQPWAGATISGAGKVQLIFDVDALALLGATSRGARPTQPVGPRRVLVVDEQRSTRDAVALVLEHAGLHAERAPDGWDALERLADRPFDLIVWRLEQEGLPVSSLLARLRASSHLHALPVVLVTSLDEATARERAPADHAAIVTLPLRRRPLLDAIAVALDAR